MVWCGVVWVGGWVGVGPVYLVVPSQTAFVGNGTIRGRMMNRTTSPSDCDLWPRGGVCCHYLYGLSQRRIRAKSSHYPGKRGGGLPPRSCLPAVRLCHSSLQAVCRRGRPQVTVLAGGRAGGSTDTRATSCEVGIVGHAHLLLLMAGSPSTMSWRLIPPSDVSEAGLELSQKAWRDFRVWSGQRRK